MTVLSEGGLRFQFPAPGRAGKYDDWTFYRKKFGHIAGTKAVDFVYATAEECWLIEVKDYSHHPKTKPTEIEREVAQKVRDTLAGLAAARRNANKKAERDLARAALRAARWRVALHLEQPQHPSRLRPRVIDPASLTTKLRGIVNAIDPHPRVVDSDCKRVPWSVERIA